MLEDLAADFRVVAYDRAGYGMSDGMHPLTVAGQVGDLVALLDVIAGGPIILVGHSWGGLLAQLAAWQCPSAIAGLVLIDPSYEEAWAAEPADTLAPLLSVPAVPGSSEWIKRLADLRADLEAEALELARRVPNDDAGFEGRLLAAALSYLETDDQAQIWFDEFPMMIQSIGEIRELRARAAPVNAPIELLTAVQGLPDGYRQSKLERLTTLIRSLGTVRHVVVADAGHYIQEKKPALVADSIRRAARRARS